VKEAGRHFPVLTSLMLLCTQIAPGATAAEATGIGVHLTVHAQNIQRAVAGGTARMSA
jgi:hypothetical protein